MNGEGKQGAATPPARSAGGLRRAAALALPAALAAVWLRTSYVNTPDVPHWDDYLSVLRSLNTVVEADAPCVAAKALFSWHGEHRPVILRSGAALYHAIFGRVRFDRIVLAGNAFLPALAVVLCAAARQRRVECLLPAMLVLLLPANWSTTWAMGAAFTNHGLLVAAFLAIVLASEGGSARIVAAALCLAAGAMFEAGALAGVAAVAGLLALQCRWRHLALFAVLSVGALAVCLAAWPDALRLPPTATAFRPLLRSPGFVVAFLGGSVKHLGGAQCSASRLYLVPGFGIVCFFVCATLVLRLHRRRPALFGFLLFLHALALMVAVGRVHYGPDAPFTPWYAAFSLAALAAILVILLDLAPDRLFTVCRPALTGALAVLYAAVWAAGYPNLRQDWCARLINMSRWVDGEKRLYWMEYGPAAAILEKSRALGVYEPREALARAARGPRARLFQERVAPLACAATPAPYPDLLFYNSGPGWTNGTSWMNAVSGWWSDPAWRLPVQGFVWDGRDDGVRLADVDGDGRLDLIRWLDGPARAGRAVWMNTGTGFSEAPQCRLPDESVGFTGAGFDDGVRFLDLNADGFIDILWSHAGLGYAFGRAYINRMPAAPGWQDDLGWRLPEGAAVLRDGRDGGVRFADVDGDGDLDVLWSAAGLRHGHRATFINRLPDAQGWEPSARWALPGGSIVVDGEDNGVRMADVNGDGFLDVLWYASRRGSDNRHTYLNRRGAGGTGWEEDPAWVLPAGNFVWEGGDDGLRLVDVNRDGYLDVVWYKSRPGHADRHTYVNRMPRARGWEETPGLRLPAGDILWDGQDAGLRFDVLAVNGRVCLAAFLCDSGPGRENRHTWLCDGRKWKETLEYRFPWGNILWEGRDDGLRLADLKARPVPGALYGAFPLPGGSWTPGLVKGTPAAAGEVWR